MQCSATIAAGPVRRFKSRLRCFDDCHCSLNCVESTVSRSKIEEKLG